LKHAHRNLPVKKTGTSAAFRTSLGGDLVGRLIIHAPPAVDNR
jgi:hypothetical protein